MNTKEHIMVGVGALLLANLSVVTTLFATGFWGSSEDEVEIVEEEVPAEEVPPPVEEPKASAYHNMAEAIYVCQDKLVAGRGDKVMSHSLDTVASRYNEEEGKYTIFFETYTASQDSSPGESKSVMCDVSHVDMSIKGWKVLPL